MHAKPMLQFTGLIIVAVAISIVARPAIGMTLGEKLFRSNCIGCHSINCNRTGPKLKNILGRKAGSLADFSHYSEPLKNSGIVWSEAKLDEFLTAPSNLVPGTAMSIVSIKDAKERREIISFVKKQDTSVDLCF
jgi:cytochrome c